MKKLEELVMLFFLQINDSHELFFNSKIDTILYIEREIQETMLVIKNLEKELAQEEEIRRNKAEYDKLAAEINQQKTRNESSR